MRRLAVLMVCAWCFASARAQDADSLAAVYLGGEEWFELRRLAEERRDEMSPFVRDFSYAMLYSWMNRPEQACETVGRLLSDYGSELGEANTVSMVTLLAMNLERSGRCSEAAETLAGFLDGAGDILPAERAAELRRMERRCSELSRYDLYERSGRGGCSVPMHVEDFDGRGAYMIKLAGRLNGRRSEFVFDTGASVNVVSPRAAAKYGMDILDVEVAASGIASGTGRMAVARELEFGGLKFDDVPFYVLEMSTGNEKADAVLSELEVIIGVPVMEKLGYVCLDFANGRMTAGDASVAEDDAAWGLACCAGGVVRVEAGRLDRKLSFVLDTGSAVSHFDPRYYAENKEYVDIVGRRDTVSLAGFGGTVRRAVAELPRACFDVGGRRCCFRRMAVYLPADGDGAGGTHGVFGMDLLLKFERAYLDFDAMRFGLGPVAADDGR